MPDLTNFVFEPPAKFQRKGKPVIKFTLRPLNQRTFFTMNADMRRGGKIGQEGAFAAFEFGVVSWECEDIPYSHEAKYLVMEGAASMDWVIWIFMIAGELYRRATLGEPEVKNS